MPSKPKRIVLRTDGASRGNPGPSGAGAILEDAEGNLLREVSEYLGRTTNNVAEYRALLLGLRAAQEFGAEELELRLDSELLARQLTGRYRVKSPHLIELHREAKRLLEDYARVDIRHIPREANGRADRLAGRAIREHLRQGKDG